MPHFWTPLRANPNWGNRKREVRDAVEGKRGGRVHGVFMARDDDTRGYALIETPEGADVDELARDLRTSRADLIELRPV